MEFIDLGDVGEGLDVVGSLGGRVCSFSEDCAFGIGISLSNSSSLGKKSPPFGTFSIC